MESRARRIADVFQPGRDRAVGAVELLSEYRLARPVENLEIVERLAAGRELVAERELRETHRAGVVQLPHRMVGGRLLDSVRDGEGRPGALNFRGQMQIGPEGRDRHGGEDLPPTAADSLVEEDCIQVRHVGGQEEIVEILVAEQDSRLAYVPRVDADRRVFRCGPCRRPPGCTS